MKFNVLIASLITITSLCVHFNLKAQSPGNVGQTNLTAWFNPDNLPLGNATSWTTTYPTGGSAITLNELAAPYPTVTNTPLNNISNYNKTISFLGNTVAMPMALEFQGAINLLNNNLSTSTGTYFAVYHMNPAAAGQHIVDYRESTSDAIQHRWLSASVTRLAIATTNSTNACRDYAEDGRPMIASYSGNRSGAATMKCRKKSLEWTNAISSSASTSAQLGLTVGARRNTSLVYSGMCESYISELIFFNTDLSLNDNIKVESYLAVKYGITLDPTGLSVGNYLASNNTTIWNAFGNLNYHNDVIGIGRDDNTSLNQKQSHTFTDSTKLYLGLIASTNLLNSAAYTNDASYIIMGSNTGARNETATATAEIPPSQNVLSRIEREWRVTNTNMSNTFSIDITLENFINFTSNPANLCLLIDDDGDFTNATAIQTGLTFTVNGNIVTVSGIGTGHIPMNSTKYITLGNLNIPNIPVAGTTVSTATTICVGDPFTLSLNGASSFLGQTYQWESSSNNITYSPITAANSSTFSPSPTSNTYYHCVVTLGANSSTSSNLLITVNSLPNVTASATPNDTVCAGTIVTLLGNGANTYTWNGISTQTSDTTLASPASGIYTIVGTDGNGCSNSATIILTVNPLPTLAVSASPNDTVCVGTVVTLLGGGANTYTWNGLSTQTSDTTLASPASGTYTIVGTDINGCVNSATINLTVNLLPTITSSASPNDTVCSGSVVTLSGSGADTYTWNGISTQTSDTTLASPASGTYTIVGTDVNGCSNSATINLTVNPLPIVMASATPNDTICAGTSVTLLGGGANTYTWNGLSTLTSDTTLSTPVSGMYTIVGTDVNGCSNSATINLTVNALPVVTASTTPSTTCNNTSVTAMGGGANTYVWSGGLIDNTPFVATTGTTTYTVTGTDANGCENTASTTVTVNPASSILAPSTTNQIQNQGDDFSLSYYDASCNLIASVDDGVGGNILGLTTSIVNVDANAGVYNGQPFVRRWYQITPANNVGVSATVTLYIDQADFTNYNSMVAAPYLPMPTSGNNTDPNIANIRITKNSDAGLGNSPEVITPTVNWNGTYWELTFPVTGFSQFRVHSVNPFNAALPATITKFNGRKLNSSDMLEWTTSSEQNNAYFNLQHSTNGVDFKTIAKVNSKVQNGNSQTELNYSYEHQTPSLGHNYYRLQQVDIDNQSSIYAKVVDLIWGANGNTVSIYPNPTQGVLNIELYTTKVQNTTVKVLDMSGRVVKQIQAHSEAGMNSLSVSLGELASGVYTVQVFDNDKLSHVSKVNKN